MKHLALILIAFVALTCTAQVDSLQHDEVEFTCGGTECDITFTTEDEGEKEVYSFTEEMPEFPGGIDSLYKFLNSNLRYPKEERRNLIQGAVFVRFIVENDGSVSSPEILRPVEGGPGLSAEALRVITLLPKWNPAKQAGKNVSTYFTLRVKFQLT